MSSNDIAVSVRGLSKSYTIAHNTEKHTTLAEAMLHRFKNPVQRSETETFWALKDVDFDIKKGDVVGIIGRNGAGKSTLLKILSQITEPTQGEINLYGRVGSLLEVGTGFHPELTGRENIFLNGAILGMRKSEIQRQFDAIVDFAEVEKFLDTPVKRYSSGMYVRLAFAVAAHLNPEILIVDEVLAVGDATFQKKCLGKMKDVSQGGKTVLFVSHNIAAINTLCSKCLMLRSGTVEVFGMTEEVIPIYLNSSSNSIKQDIGSRTDRDGDGQMRCTGISLCDSAMNEISAIPFNENFNIVIDYESRENLSEVVASIDIETIEGVRIATLYSSFMNQSFFVKKGYGSLVCHIDKLWIRPDIYSINILLGHEHQRYDFVNSAAMIEVREEHAYTTGRIPNKEHGVIMSDYSWSIR